MICSYCNKEILYEECYYDIDADLYLCENCLTMLEGGAC